MGFTFFEKIINYICKKYGHKIDKNKIFYYKEKNSICKRCGVLFVVKNNEKRGKK